MKSHEIQALVQFAHVGIRVVNERLLTLLGMIICAALFAVVMWQPDWVRLAAAGAFAVLVYLPLLRHEQQKKQEPKGEIE